MPSTAVVGGISIVRCSSFFIVLLAIAERWLIDRVVVMCSPVPCVLVVRYSEEKVRPTGCLLLMVVVCVCVCVCFGETLYFRSIFHRYLEVDLWFFVMCV